jgi:hypothetical protein
MSLQRDDLIRKYGIDGSIQSLQDRTPTGEHVDMAIDGVRRVFTPVQAFHEQIRSAAELVLNSQVKPVEVLSSFFGEYDLGTSDDPEFDQSSYEQALENQAKGPTAIQRIRVYRPEPWVEPHAAEFVVSMPWQVETMCRSILRNSGIVHCFWCFWSNWEYDRVAMRLVPGSAASNGMLISSGSTTVLLGTCDQCRRRFAGDLAATGETGQIDYVSDGFDDDLGDDE